MGKRFIALFALLGLLLAPSVAFGQAANSLGGQIKGKLGETGTEVGLSTQSLQVTVGALIQQFLTLIGVVLVVVIIYAGFMWMTAGGDTEKIKKAKAWLTNAIVGLIIVFAAYAIAEFVIDAIITGTTG